MQEAHLLGDSAFPDGIRQASAAVRPDGISQPGIMQAGAGQVRAGQVRVGEICPVKLGIGKLGAAKIGPQEICLAQVGFFQVADTERRIGKIGASQGNVTQIRPRQADTV